MYSRSKRFLSRALYALTFMTFPVLAHHGWSGNTEDIVLSGTLSAEVSLAGPHGTMQVEDSEGQLWDITLAPASRTSRAGLTENVIPLGAEVTVQGQRNSDQARLEIKTRRVSWNGQIFDVYPAR